jgi:hypothetical protein
MRSAGDAGVSREDERLDESFTPTEPSKYATFDVAVALLIGIGLLLRLAFLKEHFDVDWEPDGYKHVIISKAVFSGLPGSLWYANEVWAKPVYTLFFAALYKVLPSSWPAIVITQVANSVLWTAVTVIVLMIGRTSFRNRNTLIVLGALSTFAYVSFRASVSANTEAFGAFIFALGLLLYQRRLLTASMLMFGLELLVRLDAMFCVVVFPLWAMAREMLDRDLDPLDRIARSLRYGLAFALPLVIWNLLGFWRTGSPLFVITQGYPLTAGLFGFGGLTYYGREFIAFDAPVFLLFAVGSLMVLVRRADQLLLVSTVAALLYLLIMVVIWWIGRGAGLLRYFVFQYPLWILIGGVPVEAGLNWLQRTRSRWTSGVVAIVCLAAMAPLHWLVRAPQVRNSVLTRVPDNQARSLPALLGQRATLPLYTERPDLLYYFGRDQLYGDLHPVEAVRQKDLPGIFVFTQGWTEQFSQLTAKDFAGLPEQQTLQGPWGEVFHVYVRQ